MSTQRCNRLAFSISAAVILLPACTSGSVPSRAGLTAERPLVHPAYSVLHSFAGSEDGSFPDASLIDVGGVLYGTTSRGGSKQLGRDSGRGTVFTITSSGAKTVIHRFRASKYGVFPNAPLIDVDGTLYGTTELGGANGKLGTLFAMTSSGTETVLHSFGGSGDGARPVAGLVSVKGVLYGTTYDGGTHGLGTVFSVTSSGVETVVYNFAGGAADGEYPHAPLTNVGGTLYGTTVGGGSGLCAGGCGTVFSVTTSGKENVLHSFTGGSDGKLPMSSLVNVKGKLYGTTSGGGTSSEGTVFSITRSGAEAVAHNFGQDGDGIQPEAGLIAVGATLYGTTYWGGDGTQCSGGCGTVFAITTSGNESVLYSFAGQPDGANPQASLLNVNGTLYGTSLIGGTSNDGTVFSLTP